MEFYFSWLLPTLVEKKSTIIIIVIIVDISARFTAIIHTNKEDTLKKKNQ